MAKSHTVKTSGAPGIVSPHYYKTTIEGQGKKRSGVGKTPEQAGKNAKKNYEKAKKK